MRRIANNVVHILDLLHVGHEGHFGELFLLRGCLLELREENA